LLVPSVCSLTLSFFLSQWKSTNQTTTKGTKVPWGAFFFLQMGTQKEPLCSLTVLLILHNTVGIHPVADHEASRPYQ
jgi:hypothetical protein